MQDLLSSCGISYLRIDGNSTLEMRKRIIDQFQSDCKYQVLLLTLGTGAVGLNLTAASHVHVIEPHWNPFVEEQGAARVHRIGQEKNVYIYRYIIIDPEITDSVEQRVETMKKRKLNYAKLLHANDTDNHYGNKVNVS